MVQVVRTREGASFSYDDCGEGQAAALAAFPSPRDPKMGGGGRINGLPGFHLALAFTSFAKVRLSSNSVSIKNMK